MISQMFNITEEQIVWLKQKAILEQGTASQILRRVLREAMERAGTDTTTARDALLRQITEN